MPELTAKSVLSRRRGAALTALLAGVAVLACGCGQKGPLVLPAPPASSAAASASAR